MTLRALFLLLLLPLVASCGTGGRKDMNAADEAARNIRPTVMSFSDMTFTPLALPGHYTADVTAADPVFDFGSGNISYFKAFELPVHHETYIFETISDWYHYDCYPCSTGFFYAHIQFLDADKQPVAPPTMIGPEILDKPEEPIRRHLSAVVSPESDVRYAVVYTTTADANKDEWFKYGGPTMAAGGGFFITVPYQLIELHGTPVGVMNVSLRTAKGGVTP
ncbi:hypothetical protein [Parvibaculum sp.]|uniref:hypothetical protein n=1 Tax=Parvibaculum sp. TaxID=2024848 RepID=UPI001AFF9066|nr:hypothetical protein [Parvibaculum sp.]MBO6633747.1 hypothetical protein [Parvibaculum sp.]MBO6677023.1 hypothetical protein [Parvibaculum sp.]MBO6683453.1 hypothetical protein [Parvibaculum sp.]MBO6904830.1 hypothetical protein [Parvibaculum sp.]